MWHAGGGPGRLAEEYRVPTLHQEQQANHLVLAGIGFYLLKESFLRKCFLMKQWFKIEFIYKLRQLWTWVLVSAFYIKMNNVSTCLEMRVWTK